MPFMKSTACTFASNQYRQPQQHKCMVKNAFLSNHSGIAILLIRAAFFFLYSRLTIILSLQEGRDYSSRNRAHVGLLVEFTIRQKTPEANETSGSIVLHLLKGECTAAAIANRDNDTTTVRTACRHLTPPNQYRQNKQRKCMVKNTFSAKQRNEWQLIA